MATQLKVNGVGVHIDGREVWKSSEGFLGASSKFLFRLGEDGTSYYDEHGNELSHLRGKSLEQAVKSVLWTIRPPKNPVTIIRDGILLETSSCWLCTLSNAQYRTPFILVAS